MNALKKYWLNHERVHIELSLERLERISSYVAEIESGSGFVNKLKRLHTLPKLKAEQKHLEERREEMQSKLQEIKWKLRDG